MYSNFIFTCEKALKGMKIVQGENYGSMSRCFDSNFPRPLCLNTECSEEKSSVIVHVNEDAFECTYDGQKFNITSQVEGESIYFECPRKAIICPE